MKWIKFIAASIIFLYAAGKVSACVDTYTPASCYMFSVYNRNQLWNDKISCQKNNIDFWRQYTRNMVSEAGIKADLYPDSYYTPEQGKSKPMSLYSYLQQKKDIDAAHYIALLKQINGLSSEQDVWDYPTNKELARRHQVWLNILNDASRRMLTSKRLGSRYWLMAIRAAYYSNNKTKCQLLWNKYAAKYPNDYIKDLAQGYLASYWYKDGQREKAREFYAKVGDLQSLRWCFCKDIGLKGIMKLYEEAPTSVAFPYLIQDYVNSMDNDWTNASSSWVSKQESDSTKQVLAAEMKEFRSYAETVINEGKIQNPALWKTAAAYFAYLMGDNKTSLKELADADAMNGTDRMKENIRTIRFLVQSDASEYNTDFDNYVLGEVKWLMEKIKTEPMYTQENYFGSRNHYSDALQRIAYFHLTPNYIKAGKFTTGASLTGMTYEYLTSEVNNQKRDGNKVADPENNADYNKPFDYNNQIFNLLDTVDVKNVIAYEKLLTNPDNGTELEKYAASYCYKNDDYYNELIGTKLLRSENFEQAEGYLKKVSLGYIGTMNIAPYMHVDNAQSYWFAWQTRKDLQKRRYLATAFSVNPKLAFCQNMISLKQRLEQTTDSIEKSKIYYELAERYTQASRKGYCWEYLHYSWSIDTETVRTYHQENYLGRAEECLQQSLAYNRSTDNRVKCLFALASLSNDLWKTIDEYADDKIVYHPNSVQAKRFDELYQLRESVSYAYYKLSKCDNLKEYYDYVQHKK